MKRSVHISMLLVVWIANASARAGDATKNATADSESAVPFAAVDPSDGIDASEARAIADEYFAQEYGSCGGSSTLRRRGRTWVFSVLFGLTGEKLKETIRVDARTGGVWSAGGPRYQSLQAFREKTTADEERRDGAKLDAVQQGVAADGVKPRRRTPGR